MDYFYDYIVDIYTYLSHKDKYGFNRDEYTKKDTIECDIQPIGNEKIKRDYGYNIEANFKMYSDTELNESDIVLWNNKTYKIQKNIPWNDYNIYLLKDEVIDLGL